jgi:hypothetical protein
MTLPLNAGLHRGLGVEPQSKRTYLRKLKI